MSLCLGLSTLFLRSLPKKMIWNGLDFSVDVFLFCLYVKCNFTHAHNCKKGGVQTEF